MWTDFPNSFTTRFVRKFSRPMYIYYKKLCNISTVKEQFQQHYMPCIYYKNFHLTCNMLLHYLVKFEHPKMLWNFHTECDN